MAKTIQLLSVLARLNPAIFDVIYPHGPAQWHAFASRINEVALNPQPLPPEPPPEMLQRASALVAHNIAFAAISMEAAGQDGGARMINSAIDVTIDKAEEVDINIYLSPQGAQLFWLHRVVFEPVQ